MSNPRQQLREAIKASAAALSELRHAENMLDRAHSLYDSLVEKRDEQFANLDDEMGRARADNLKRAIQGDENAHLLQEPGGFAAALIARDHLDQQIAGVHDSLPVLEAELTDARRAAEEADYTVELCRERVFADEAERLAQEFMQKLAEIRRMSIRLRFMALRQVRRDPNARSLTGGQFYGQGHTRNISMPQSVAAAVHEEVMGDFDIRGGLKMREELSTRVADYWARLRIDPEAEFNEDRPQKRSRSMIEQFAIDLLPGDENL
ncbi:hypothetical protein [Methylocystis echinoides]|uniref:hypothetical protein n=1 Tax=Methylocystis echinoides TaxID=29468 RepID=UPI0034387398